MNDASNYHHVMLDIETISTWTDAAILSIGAIRFDPEAEGDGLGPEFYRVCSLQDSLDAGLRIDGDTVYWWSQQSDEARAAWNTDPMPLKLALEQFSLFLRGSGLTGAASHGTPEIWGYGANFDNPILMHTYRMTGLDLPWSYRQDRCMRTLVKLAQRMKIKYPRTKSTIQHHALEDARVQAVKTVAILRALSRLKEED